MTPKQIAAQITENINVNNGLAGGPKESIPPHLQRQLYLQRQLLRKALNARYDFESTMSLSEDLHPMFITNDHMKEMAAARYYEQVPTQIPILPKKLYEHTIRTKPIHAHIIPKPKPEMPKSTNDLGKRRLII